MNRMKRNGSAIVLALVAVSLVGSAVAILSASSSEMVFDANRAYLEACSRNLAASALAWAHHHRRRPAASRPAGEVPLDVEDLEIPNASLRVALTPLKGDCVGVRIASQCRRSRLPLNRQHTYRLGPLRPKPQ